MKDLQQVVGFLVRDDVLYFELAGNVGTMRFGRMNE